MQKNESPWSTGALLICTKCGKSISRENSQDPDNVAENLKKYLKSNLKELGLQKNFRILTSSCLDICEPEMQAVSYCSTDGVSSKHLTLNPDRESEELLHFLQNQVKK